MKCLVISEIPVVVSGFKEMGVEAILAQSEEDALSEVEKAITCRDVGTLILSPHVGCVSKTVLDSHAKSGRLPYVIYLKD